MSLPGLTVQSTAYWTRQFLDNISDRVQELDEMIMLNSETLIQYNQRKYHSLVDGMTRLNMFGSDIIVGELESTVEEKTSNDEFFDAFVDLEPVATVDCHYDAIEGQHFFDCEELEQELFKFFFCPFNSTYLLHGKRIYQQAFFFILQYYIVVSR